MFYKHWKKLALALTGFFWASCDSDSTSANGSEDPSSSSITTPESSSSVNQAQESSSSEATGKGTSSSSFEEIMPAYGVSDDPLLSSSSRDSVIAQPLYGVTEILYMCEQAEGDSTMTCGDGVNCTLRSQESWESLPCIEDICPDYGVVRISENTYECNGKIYSEAEFRSRYSQVIIPKDSSEATGSETLCFNDSAQNVEGRMFKIIDCTDGNKFLRDPSAAGAEGVELPEGVQVFAPKAGSEQAPNCTENGDVCIERNPNIPVEQDTLAGCHPIIDCPEKSDATYIKVD